MIAEDLAAALERLRPDLIRFARSRVGVADAEDAVEDTICRLLPCLDRYRHPHHGTLSYAAVYSTLRRVCIDLITDERTDYATLQAYDAEPQEPRVSPAYVERVRSVVPHLVMGDMERECLLSVLDGEDVGAIADRLRLTRDQVTQAIARGRRRIAFIRQALL